MAMRKCIRCGPKDESKFNFRDEKRGLLQYVCRDCQREQGRDRYANNKENVLEINRQSTQKSQMHAASFIQEYLSDKSCADCGERDTNVLTFDHVSREKRDNVSDMVRQGFSIKTIALEIEKTDVVCFNCHMRHEQSRSGYSRFGRFG